MFIGYSHQKNTIYLSLLRNPHIGHRGNGNEVFYFHYFRLMKATYPGEYIHAITVELSTVKDGKAIMFLSVDGYSRYCFSNVVLSPLTFEKLVDHLETIIVELRKRYPELVPTFIMGYADDMQFKLGLHYKGRAHFQFNKHFANAVALPAARDILKHIK